MDGWMKQQISPRSCLTLVLSLCPSLAWNALERRQRKGGEKSRQTEEITQGVISLMVALLADIRVKSQKFTFELKESRR